MDHRAICVREKTGVDKVMLEFSVPVKEVRHVSAMEELELVDF